MVHKQTQTRAQTIVVMGGTLGTIVASITTKHLALRLILGFNQQQKSTVELREARRHVFRIKRGSNMSAHVLLNLFNSFGKRDKMRGKSSIYRFFCNEFIKKNSIIQEYDVLSYVTKRTLKSRFWRKRQDCGYGIGDQPRLRRTCAFNQSYQSFHCSNTQNMEYDKAQIKS